MSHLDADILKHRTLNLTGSVAPNNPPDLGDEDPGTCGDCGNTLELVRPGKSQCNHCPQDESSAPNDLPRYGLQWHGSSFPIPVPTPMPDGYWSPWHLADSRIWILESALRELGRCRVCYGRGTCYVTFDAPMSEVACGTCNGTGLHPIAQKALAP